MGIDLASRERNTAVCLLEWREDAVAVVALVRGQTDDGMALHTKWLSNTAYGNLGKYGGPITKVGIDAPFGWPEPFFDALASYRGTGLWPSGLDDPLDECRLRETDRAVYRRTKKTPLSVASDKIAMPAMRCATLLTDLQQKRDAAAVARDGSGLCCEVYPDPALRFWTGDHPNGLAPRESYKGKKAARRRTDLLTAIQRDLPMEDERGLLERIGLEDDYLDALVCALVARATELGLTYWPESEAEIDRAPLEGWIHVPSAPLFELLGRKV